MSSDSIVRLPPSLAPEHDWTAASKVIHPCLRPIGTHGSSGRETRVPSHGSPGEPIIAIGPAGLPIVYILPASGFDVVVSMEHVLSWGVTPDQIAETATANLAEWSATAAWTDEMDGGRRVVWSDWCSGSDAARILLPEVRRELSSSLGPLGRVLIGLPERNLLMAASLAEGDHEFAEMFADYIDERFSDSDEPIDPRVFELIDEVLVEFAPLRALA